MIKVDNKNGTYRIKFARHNRKRAHMKNVLKRGLIKPSKYHRYYFQALDHKINKEVLKYLEILDKLCLNKKKPTYFSIGEYGFEYFNKIFLFGEGVNSSVDNSCEIEIYFEGVPSGRIRFIGDVLISDVWRFKTRKKKESFSIYRRPDLEIFKMINSDSFKFEVLKLILKETDKE